MRLTDSSTPPQLTFHRDTRLMLIAPHPDDESLACSVILQKAVRAGAAVRVVYATDGENNPWPQRLLARKWRICERDRARWGKLRRREALAALRALDVDLAEVEFLGLPDQGLTNLLLGDCRSLLVCLESSIADWAPTDLLIPSMADIHPDHNALALLMRLVLRQCGNASVWDYIVHGRSAAFLNNATALDQSTDELVTKICAISCHKTQLVLSRKRFLAYAARPECLAPWQDRHHTLGHDNLRVVSRNANVLELDLGSRSKTFTFVQPRLYVLGRNLDGTVVHSSVSLLAADKIISVSMAKFSPAHPIFVKLDRRQIFFDEAGWLEVPALTKVAMPALETEEPLFAIR